MPARRPTAVAFDVNETLFGLEPLRGRLVALGLPPPALEWWFASVLRDGFALAVAGGNRPFPEVAAAALGEVVDAWGLSAGPDVARSVLAGFEELDPHPDVGPALKALADAGVGALCLTNGSARVVASLLRRSGLAPLVSHVLSVDEVGRWKPGPEPYLHAAEVAGVAPDELALVAVHPWDVHGASSAGLVGAWVRRSARTYPDVFTVPDIEGGDLVEVVERLLALPGR
jgi:2-haloacid dehalogenase